MQHTRNIRTDKPSTTKDIQNVCNCKTMEQPDNNNVDHRPHHHHPTGGGESLRLILLYLIYV